MTFQSLRSCKKAEHPGLQRLVGPITPLGLRQSEPIVPQIRIPYDRRLFMNFEALWIFSADDHVPHAYVGPASSTLTLVGVSRVVLSLSICFDPITYLTFRRLAPVTRKDMSSYLANTNTAMGATLLFGLVLLGFSMRAEDRTNILILVQFGFTGILRPTICVHTVCTATGMDDIASRLRLRFCLLTTTMLPPSEYERYCSNFSSTPTTSALDRIGARIPQEVLLRILLFIWHGHGVNRKERRDMGQLALTCRYWATKCQPAIFEMIKLRSGKDVDALLSLMASPLSRVASYIKTLVLYHDQSNAPWLHLVALRLVPKLSLDTEDPIHLSLTNVDGIRSIHDGLPRSHPSFSFHISDLWLSNARVNSIAALLHLVDEMPFWRHTETARVRLRRLRIAEVVSVFDWG